MLDDGMLKPCPDNVAGKKRSAPAKELPTRCVIAPIDGWPSAKSSSAHRSLSGRVIVDEASHGLQPLMQCGPQIGYYPRHLLC
jgi:hypothetical protein